MRVCTAAVIVTLLGTSSIFASQGQQQARPAVQIRNAIESLYISDFRNEVGLSEDQFLKVAPFLRNFVQNRFNLAQQSQLLKQRREEMTKQNPTDEEVRLLNEQILQIERQKLNSEMRFQNMIDPVLTPTQQLKARTFQDNFELRMLGLIAAARKNLEAMQEQQAIQNQRQQQQRQLQNDAARPPQTR